MFLLLQKFAYALIVLRQDYSTRLFVHASYRVLLVLVLVGGILLFLSFFCVRKPHVLCYIAILLRRSLPIGGEHSAKDFFNLQAYN
jgi:hypothetical protein